MKETSACKIAGAAGEYLVFQAFTLCSALPFPSLMRYSMKTLTDTVLSILCSFVNSLIPGLLLQQHRWTESDVLTTMT